MAYRRAERERTVIPCSNRTGLGWFRSLCTGMGPDWGQRPQARLALRLPKADVEGPYHARSARRTDPVAGSGPRFCQRCRPALGAADRTRAPGAARAVGPDGRGGFDRGRRPDRVRRCGARRNGLVRGDGGTDAGLLCHRGHLWRACVHRHDERARRRQPRAKAALAAQDGERRGAELLCPVGGQRWFRSGGDDDQGCARRRRLAHRWREGVDHERRHGGSRDRVRCDRPECGGAWCDGLLGAKGHAGAVRRQARREDGPTRQLDGGVGF